MTEFLDTPRLGQWDRVTPLDTPRLGLWSFAKLDTPRLGQWDYRSTLDTTRLGQWRTVDPTFAAIFPQD
jgi:hypothetical protein